MLQKEYLTPFQKAFDNFYRYFYKNSLFCKRNDILILSSNSSKIINREGNYKDRLFDFYANIYPKITLIMESNICLVKNFRRAYHKVVYDDLLNLACRKCKKHEAKDEDIRTTNSLIKLLKEKFPVKLDYKFYSNLRSTILEYSKEVEIMDKYYYKLFKKLKPKIVVVEDGCYGGRRFFFIKMLNDLNITTVELQHGLIHTEHGAYNYSPKLINSNEYKKNIPQYLLMFGK